MGSLLSTNKEPTSVNIATESISGARSTIGSTTDATSAVGSTSDTDTAMESISDTGAELLPFTGPSKLGLEDPRVIICHDRGEQFYQRDHPPRAPIQPINDISPLNLKDLTSDIITALEKAKVFYPVDSIHTSFVPRDKLASIMDPERVALIIASLACCRGWSRAEKEELAREVCVGGPKWCQQPCLKLLTSMITAKIQDYFLDLIRAGITDSCLPFKLATGTSNLECHVEDHRHPEFNRCLEECTKAKMEFCQWSYALSAPYFKAQPGQHTHYVLGINDTLPIMQQTQPTDAANNKEGGFGQVQRVMFHPSHFDFSAYNIDQLFVQDGENWFAQKMLYESDLDNFNKELASLLSFQDRHLIQLLVTFEIRPVNGLSKYYFVFPWAQGNLWDFWEMHQAESERIPRCIWMSEQCFGLGVALSKVHNNRSSHLKKLKDIRKEDYDLFGRHGDIKAENVLYFENRDLLALCDLGLGRLHSKISRSNQDPKLLEKTATYRAPEFDTFHGKISRISDIFSLGCMFLEFVTWYLLGWESVSKTFSNYRMEEDRYQFVSDTFFRIEGDEPVIKPKVVEWIRGLRASPHCNQYILDFLDLIEHYMLNPDSKKRIGSDKLVNKLHLLRETCRRDSEYWREERLANPNSDESHTNLE